MQAQLVWSRSGSGDILSLLLDTFVSFKVLYALEFIAFRLPDS